MCTDYIFVEIPKCSFKVHNILCKLHIIRVDNTFLNREGMRYFCVDDAHGNLRGSLSMLQLKEILQTLETHTLITESQFKTLKSMDLEKTIHFYKTVVKVEKEKTFLERLKGFFVEDPKKNAFLKSSVYFVDSRRIISPQSQGLEDESRPSTSREFVRQSTAKKQKGKKAKTTTSLLSESEESIENDAQPFDN